MRGASNHQHVALVGAGVILSALAMFVVTPSAAAVVAVGGAGAILALPPLTSTNPPGRRLPVRVGAATLPTRGRPPVRSRVAPAGAVARAVGVLRRVIGVGLRMTLRYLGPPKVVGVGPAPAMPGDERGPEQPGAPDQVSETDMTRARED